MVVEFIGTPGSGKSTLLPVILAYFQERQRPAYIPVDAARPFTQRLFLGRLAHHLTPPSLRRPLLWQVFYFLSVLYRLRFYKKYSNMVRWVVTTQNRRPPEAEIREKQILHWFYYTIGCYEFLTSYQRPEEVLVFDEGFIHRVVQFFASDVEEPDDQKIRTYLDLVPRPDLVIHVRASPQICEKRIVQRGVWEFFKHKRPEDLNKYVANSHLVIQIAIAHMKEKGWALLEINNENPEKTVEKNLQDMLKGFLEA
jgi:adenylate kinase family enzyme